MKICGVEIKGSEAIIVIVESDGDKYTYLNAETKRFPLADDEDVAQIKSFSLLIKGFARDNNISLIAIKKRNKGGAFSAGGVTFKIEGIIQLSSDCDVVLLAAPTISAATKKHKFIVPPSLRKYQEEAFLTACTAHMRNQE